MHNVHVGAGTPNLNCDTCHGFPPKYPITVNEGAGSGHYVVCEQCHAPPPDSFKPSMGNIITIHLSRNTYCTNCHDTDNITPAHPSTKAENGTVQIIKCENCHRDAERFTSHINGGNYCLNCHGNSTATASIISTTVPVETMPITTYTVSTPVSTYTSPVVKQRAQIQVTYEVGAGSTRQELTITVNLKNTGNATASHINLSINNPPELQAAALSGSDKIGETILWKGELKPGEEHIAKYSVKAISGRNLEIPLKVTYAKVSPEEKAKALGVLSASASTEQLLAPEDWEVISLIIKIAAAVPGFEAILAVVSLLLVDVIWRNRR